jgi:deoxyribodipyrimidine photo-lyase
MSKKEGVPLLPVFLIEPYMTNGDPQFQFGYPSRYFLSRAIPAFAELFPSFYLGVDKPVRFFVRLAKQFNLTIFVNEDVHPDFYAQLRKIRDHGITVKLFRDQLTVSKETVTGAGNRYSIFTPFKHAVWESFIEESEDKKVSLEGVHFFDARNIKGAISPKNPEKILGIFSKKEAIIVGYGTQTETIVVSKLGLPERTLAAWYVSEAEALAHWKKFLTQHLLNYKTQRDQLDHEATSRMSLALTWGLVSARTMAHLLQKHAGGQFKNPHSLLTSQQGPIHFISELIWREFYKYLYFHNPTLFSESFQKKFAYIPWVPHPQALERFTLWMQGKTGYPIVDAAMMQLAKTGYMHNRARMIVASVLTKNLGVDWRWGQEYFRAMLIDLDESSNNGGWQWGASVGADPKPIRIFNPYLQAEKYDPHNRYQKEWLPEAYYKSPPPVIIEHPQARKEALGRYGLAKHTKSRDY